MTHIRVLYLSYRVVIFVMWRMCPFISNNSWKTNSDFFAIFLAATSNVSVTLIALSATSLAPGIRCWFSSTRSLRILGMASLSWSPQDQILRHAIRRTWVSFLNGASLVRSVLIWPKAVCYYVRVTVRPTASAALPVRTSLCAVLAPHVNHGAIDNPCSFGTMHAVGKLRTPQEISVNCAKTSSKRQLCLIAKSSAWSQIANICVDLSEIKRFFSSTSEACLWNS